MTKQEEYTTVEHTGTAGFVMITGCCTYALCSSLHMDLVTVVLMRKALFHTSIRYTAYGRDYIPTV